MKTIVLLLLGGLLSGPLTAQVYNVTTDKKDPFSLAFVKLLNSAVHRFKDVKGDSLRSTWMGTDYQLNIPFPGTTMAIVRSSDHEKNAYLEFRGFANKKERDQGIRDIVAKIKKALGDQLYDRYEGQPEKEIYFYGLYIKDKNGFFGMNMELFGSSSSSPIYLLGPDKEDETKPKEHFVLLKIYSGTPYYQYYVKPVPAPGLELDATLRQLIQAASTDFADMPAKKMDTVRGRRKGLDTLHLNGFAVQMNYWKANYSADLLFPAEADTAVFSKQWAYYQQALQAALGTDYVYHLYTTQERPSVQYYLYGGEQTPRVYLEQEKGYNKPLYIRISIESAVSHPTKRSYDWDD